MYSNIPSGDSTTPNPSPSELAAYFPSGPVVLSAHEAARLSFYLAYTAQLVPFEADPLISARYLSSVLEREAATLAARLRATTPPAPLTMAEQFELACLVG